MATNLEKKEKYFSVSLSEIRKLTKKLESIEERRKNALSASFVGIWEWNIKDNLLIWDEGMFNIYDISGDNFHGQYDEWKSRLHPDDFIPTEKNLLECVENPEKRYFYRFRVKRNDKWRWVSGIGNTIRDDDDKVIKVVGINILEPNAEESTSFDPRDLSIYKDSIESAIFPTALSSSKGELVYANKSYLDLVGADTIDEVKGFQWIKVLDEKTKDKILEGYNQFLSQKIEKFWGYVKYQNIKTKNTFIKKVICSILPETDNYNIVLVDINFQQPKDFIKASYYVKEIEEEIELKESISLAVNDVHEFKKRSSFNILWKFQIRRALLEIMDKKIGTIERHNEYGISTVTFKKEYLDYYKFIEKELRETWDFFHGKLNDCGILEEIEKMFGEKILNNVCIPCQTLQGACLLAALAVAQNKETINIDLS